MRTKRHDAVVKYVKKRLEGKRMIVHEEPHFATAGGLRKPDMVVELEDSTLIIDAQIVSEQRHLEQANADKVSKYNTEEIKEQVRRRYGKQQIEVAALTLNMLGLWSKTSAEQLKKKGLISSMDIWILSSRVLIRTLACWHCHQASTEMVRRRRGEGQTSE